MTTAPTPLDGTSPVTAARRADVLIGRGVALLSAAIVLSTVYSRRDGDLDLSNFGVGIIATLVLLGVAALGITRTDEPDLRTTLVSWPSTFGAIGVGLMIAVAMDANDASPWLIGLAVAAIGAGGYVVVRRPAPALAAILGLAVLYAKILDLVVDVGNGDNALMVGGLIIVVFSLAASGAAWFLPGRDVIAITVGAVTAYALVTLVAAVTLFAFFFGSFASEITDGGSVNGTSVPSDPLAPFHNDVYVLLLLGAAMIAFWSFAGIRTGHAGYRVLIVALAAAQVPLSIAVLGVDHPSGVGYVILALGAAVLATVLAIRTGGAARPRPTAPQPTDGPPPPPPPPPYGS
ncbi:hypothetical protein BH11ACT8_BH11ACT8_19600 [soil metagenome]